MAGWAKAPPAFFRHSPRRFSAVASGGAARCGGAGPPPQPPEGRLGPPRPCLFRLRSPRGVGGLGRLAAAQGAKRPTPGIFFRGLGPLPSPLPPYPVGLAP